MRKFAHLNVMTGQCTACKIHWELPEKPARCPVCAAVPVELAKPHRYYMGLDLGQSQDYTALSCLEQRIVIEQPGDRKTRHYRLMGLKRWPLKTAYPVIVHELRELVARPPLRDCKLMVDQTGVGKAVVDMLRSHYAMAGERPEAKHGLPVVLRPVLITSGHQTTMGDDGAWHVPKKELVSVVQTLLQGRRIDRADNLPVADLAMKELGTFKVKVTAAGNESFEAWRERDHDDLVLAVALAAWAGERYAGEETPLEQPKKEQRNPYEYLRPGRVSAQARRGLFGVTGRG